MFEKVLVPLDGSEQSNKALDFALGFAEKYDSEILLLSVIPPSSLSIVSHIDLAPTPFPVDAVESYQNKVRNLHKNILESALKKVTETHPKLKVSTKLIEGNPIEKILEEVEEEKSDIIIMGHRGASGIKGFFLGSVTHRVAHKCPCPIIIVK